MRSLLAVTAITFAATAALAAPNITWTQDSYGRTAIVHMATAPFPHPSRSYTDDRVMIFVPDGFRASSAVDLIVQYHGHMGEIVQSDHDHHYREQLWLSRKNAILLEPQGPLRARDSSGGKHEDPGGLQRFVSEALQVLSDEGIVPAGATPGKLLLAGHSGAYEVLGEACAKGGIEISELHLNDALYGEVPNFEAWARQPGHKLVSAYTRYAGCVAGNQQLLGRLRGDAVDVVTSDTDEALTHAAAIIETDVAHNDVTHARHRWTDALAHSVLSDLGCPRPVLRDVERHDGTYVQVDWYPVRSSVLRGYRIYGSSDGQGSWSRLADESVFGPGNTAAWVPLASGMQCFRVTAVDDLGNESAPSNAYGVRPDGASRVLVVDGFVRTNGSFTRGEHAFASLVGGSVSRGGRSFETASWRAIRDGSVSLTDYTSVVWLAGDQSETDAALDHVEEAQLTGYLRSGGTLLVSGSEIGWYLRRSGATPEDRAFWAVLPGAFQGDTDTNARVSGAGVLSGVSVTLGGGLYRASSPDFFGAGRGTIALRYGDGQGAAVSVEGTFGSAHSGVLLVGFPIETIGDAGERDALLAKVLDWEDGVNSRGGR